VTGNGFWFGLLAAILSTFARDSINNTGILQVKEELVEFQNGCICCTLREDLLKEIAKLSEQGKFD
jgi:G3E family GTPase